MTAHAKQRYFRQLYKDGHLLFVLRNEITTADTAQARCFRCTFDELNRLTSWEYISAGRVQTAPEQGIARTQIQYGDGWERLSFYDQFGQPKYDDQSVYAFKFVHDTVTRRGTIFFYGSKGNLVNNSQNCARKEVELDIYGNIVNEYCLNNEGVRTYGNDSGYCISYYYDKNQRKVEQVYWATSAKNTFKTKIQYDSLGNRIRLEYFKNGKYVTEHPPIETYSYDQNGYLTEKCRYNLSNDLIEKTKFENDVYGNDTVDIYIGPDGEILAEGGIVKIKYDKNNNPITIASLSQYGILGYYLQFSYDSDGNMIEKRYVDRLKHPIIGPDGFCFIKFFYNSEKDCIGYKNYDTEGYLVNAGEDGIAQCKIKYNASHQLLGFQFLDKGNMPVINSEYDAAAVIYNYDDGDIEVKKYDTKGNEIK